MVDGLPLFEWKPPRKVIPFPAQFRGGHAKRVALKLKSARSEREASHLLRRSLESFVKQLSQAQVGADDLERERKVFLGTIAGECHRVGSPWLPDPSCWRPGEAGNGGAA